METQALNCCIHAWVPRKSFTSVRSPSQHAILTCGGASSWMSRSPALHAAPVSKVSELGLLLRLAPWNRSLKGCRAEKGQVVARASFTEPTTESISDSASLRDQADASFSIAASPGGPDFFVLDLAEKLEDSVALKNPDSLGSHALTRLREQASEKALGSRWPTNKDEAYRFTDIRFLKSLDIMPTSVPSADTSISLSDLSLSDVQSTRLVIIDGVVSECLSNLEDLPKGAFVGSICSISAETEGNPLLHPLERLGAPAPGTTDDLFTFLNGIGVQDAGLIFVPEGVQFSKPVHVVYFSSGRGVSEKGRETSISLSSPRLLVVAEKGSQAEIVEDFVGTAGQAYWTNSVCEFSVGEGAQVSHSYIQEQGRSSVHFKQTHVSQAEGSTYKLVEAGVGGRLSRHNLQIIQEGPDTQTEFSTFQLAGKHQLQDLHSRLVLSHPRGVSRQLHKCIVTDSTGHAVFDGNVKVNRFAQQTDAGQLSRSLLLASRATVNVKPNLQIIADDVKCSHGAAISDLEEEQLFYFQARGIDQETARSALVFSFGAEVLQRLQYESLRKRVEGLVKGSLASEGVMNPNVHVGL